MEIVKGQLLSLMVMSVCLVMGSVGIFEALIDKDYPQITMGVFLILMSLVFAEDVIDKYKYSSP